MTDILQTVLFTAAIAAIGAIGTTLSALAGEYTKKIKNEKFQSIFDDVVVKVVGEVYQTYVEALKKEGKFTKSAQQHALRTAVEDIKTTLPAAVKEWVYNNYGSTGSYIASAVENAIKISKK